MAIANDATELLALLSANETEIILVSGTTYTFSNTLYVTYGVKIIGNGAILDFDSVAGFGVKVQPDSADRGDLVDGFEIDGVTIAGAGRTGLDLNGAINAVISNVTATDNGDGYGGNGITLTDSANVAVSYVTTSGNAWGGVAVYNSNVYFDQAAANIDFSGTNTFGEPVGLYAQDIDPSVITFNSAATFVVHNPDGTYYPFATADQAIEAAVALEAITGGPLAITGDGFSGNYHVVQDGESIQAAIDAATDGDTIYVSAGIYDENLVINKSLTLLALDGPGSTSIVGTGTGGNTVRIASGNSDVVIGGPGQGFTIVGTESDNDGLETATVYLTGDVDNIEIRNNTILANGEAAIISEWQQGVTNITVDGNTIGGNTYDGAAPLPVGDTVSPTNPAGFGTSPNQWNSDNVARQLVTLGQGYSGGSNAANQGDTIVFTNNTITGSSGTGGVGTGLINIEADNSTVSGNTFDPASSTGSFELRVRGEDSDVTNNQMQGQQTIIVTTLADDVSGNTSGGEPVGVIYLGNAEDNTFVGGAGNDRFEGMSGSDTVDYSATTGGVIVTSNTAFGLDPDGIGIDELSSIENVIGGSGNDTFVGQNGVANTFVGGGGNDLFNAGTGAGVDRFIYQAATAVDGMATKGTNGLSVNGGSEGIDDLRNVDEIAFADSMVVKVVNNNAAVYTRVDSLTVTDTDGTDANTIVNGSGLLSNDVNIDESVSTGDQKAVVPETIEGTYGTLQLFADGTYTYTLKASVDGLSADASETFNYNVTDGTNITPSSLTISITAANDAPVITNGPVEGGVYEAGDADTFVNASWNGIAVRPESNYVPTALIQAALDSLLGDANTAGAAVAPVVTMIENDLAASGGTRADAILAVWDYLDTFYTSAVPPATNYYHLGHNTATIRLGLEYIDYLKAGNAPLTGVIVKHNEDGSGNVTREQSLHDNLLGNINTAGLTDRFASHFGLDLVDTDIYAEISTAMGTDTAALLDRPWISGNIPGNPQDIADAALADQNLGLVPHAFGTLTATDADGDALTWSILANPSDPESDTQALLGQYGTLHVDADGNWRYELDNTRAETQALGEGDHGDPEVFTVQVDDGNGGTATTTITIDVIGTNDAPVIDAAVDNAVFAAVEDTAIVESDPASVADILANAIIDVDGDAVTVTLTLTYDAWSGGATPAPETITIAPGDDFAYTPPANYFGTIIVGVIATDTYGASDTSTFTVNVAPVNDAPVITTANIVGSIFEDGALDSATNETPASDFAVDYDLSAATQADLALLSTSTAVDVPQLLADIVGDLPDGGIEDAFAIVFNALDDFYVGSSSAVANNTAFVRLGMAYAEYLQGGGRPLTDVIVKASASRSQSLHDNLLGNITTGPLHGRFPGDVYDPVTPANSTGIFAEIRDQDLTFLQDRPYFEGSTGDDVGPSRAFDMAHNLVPHSFGTLTATDVDNTNLSWSVVGTGEGQYGTLHVNADGTWSYDLDQAKAQHLAENEAGLPELFTVQVDDGNDGIVTTSLTINVIGTNDAPVFADTPLLPDTLALTEDEHGTVLAGNIDTLIDQIVSDPDGDAVSLLFTFTYPDGNVPASWTATVDEAGNAVYNVPASLADYNGPVSVLIEATDSHGAVSTRTVAVTVTPINDAPTISGDATGLVWEPGDLDSIIGADHPTTPQFTTLVDINDEIGDLFAANEDPDPITGGFDWNMDAILAGTQALLGPDAGPSDAIAYVWRHIDLNYLGASTPATSEAAFRLGLEYVEYLQGGGKPLYDVIAKSTAIREQTLHDNLMSNVTGYALNQRWVNQHPNAALYAEFLAILTDDPALAPLVDRFPYQGNAGDVNTALAFDIEHGFLPAASGQLTANDPDIGDSHLWSVTGGSTPYGTFDIDPHTGLWTFTLTAAADGLAEGDLIPVDFTVTVTDGLATDTQIVTITINGSNDAPTVDQGISAVTTAEDDPAFSFDIPADAFADVDDGADLTYTATLADGSDLPPWLSFDGTTFSGTPSNDRVGTISVTVTATDEFGAFTSHTFDLTVTNTNDAPTFGFHQNFETDRDGVFDDTTPGWAGYGSVEVVDEYNGITNGGSNFAILKEPDPYDLVTRGPFSRLGGYRDQFVDGMTAQSKVYLDTNWADGDGFSYSVALNNSTTGAHLQDYVFNVVMTGDGLKLGAATGVGHSAPIPEPGTEGTIGPVGDIVANGWYTLQHVFNNVGGQLVVTFNVLDALGNQAFTFDYPTGHDIVDVGGNRYAWFAHITAPDGIAVDDISLTGVDSGAATEGAGGDSLVSLTGQVLFDDVDGDTVTVAFTPVGPNVGDYFGTFNATVTEDTTGASGGTITWSFHGIADHLADGETVTQTYELQIDDGQGGTATKSITVTITGTNDAPVIDAALENAVFVAVEDTAIVESDPASVAAILANVITDIDGDPVTVTLTLTYGAWPGGATPAPETIVIAPGDGFAYTPPANYFGVITVGVTATDTHGATDTSTFTVNVAPANDAPVVSVASDLAGAVTEPVTTTIEQDTGIVVVDDDAPGVTFAVDNGTNEFGIFDVDASTGEWTFTLGDGMAVQALNLGDTATTAFTVIITDAGGLQTTADVVITINGTNEVFDGTDYDDFWIGSPFVDDITGGAGDDILYGGSGDDLVNGGLGDDAIYGGSGDDTLNGDDGDDTIDGGSGDDTINGGSGDDHIRGGSGNDTIDGGDDEDFLLGGSGDDFILGGAGDDILNGGNGNDTVIGGDGDDEITGGGGSDMLIGGDGYDNLRGGAGDDVLIGGLGRDNLTGGAGADRYQWASVEESGVTTRDTILDWEAGDKIDLSLLDLDPITAGHQGFRFIERGTADLSVGEAQLKYYSRDGYTFIAGNDGNGDTANFHIRIAGNHVLDASDFIGLGDPNVGSTADDVFISQVGRDTFTGNGGNDVFVFDLLNDSRYGANRWDQITDWHDSYKIDLSRIDGNFSLTGLGARDNVVAPNSIEFYYIAASDSTFIALDGTGDGIGDFRIELQGGDFTSSLDLDNFIL